MPSFRLAKASNDAYSPSYAPVVVVFGGTSGIGRAMTKRLAEQLQGRVHIVIVGRNKPEADKLFATLPTPTSLGSPGAQLGTEPECTREFIYCDLYLMSNVHRVCAEILSRFPKINYLVLTAGAASFGARCETEEGIDRLFALRFYWKFAAINDLLPGLRAARDRGRRQVPLYVWEWGMGRRSTLKTWGPRQHFCGGFDRTGKECRMEILH